MVLIYTQNWGGKFKKLSYELISYGVALSKKLNTQAVALSIGDVADEELKTLGKYGIEKVITLNDEKLSNFDNKVFSKVIAEVAEKIDAKIFVFAHNNEGKAIAPRIAAKFKASLITSVADLPENIDPFIIQKKAPYFFSYL